MSSPEYVRVAGIDASMSNIGLVIVQAVVFEHVVTRVEDVFCGCYQSSEKLRSEERAEENGRYVRSILEDHGVHLGAIEGYSFNSRHGGEVLGETGGQVKLAVRDATRQPCLLLTPASVKLFTLGKGTGSKALILKEVFKRWGFDTENEHVADAYAVARLALSYQVRALNIHESGLIVPQVRAVEAVVKAMAPQAPVALKGKRRA